MSQNEVLACLVGWIDGRFSKGRPTAFDEENASIRGFSYSPRGQLRRLRCIYDSKGIRDFQFSFDSLLESSSTEGKQMEFDFEPGERLASLGVYISFSSEETKTDNQPTFISPLKSPAQQPLIPPEEKKDREHVSSDPSAPYPPESEESGHDREREQGSNPDGSRSAAVPVWGMKEARVCGIEFTTTLNRSFKVIASDPFLFKTRYDVNVESGICREANVITGLGFVFFKDASSTAQKSGGANRGGIFGCLYKLFPFCLECIEGIIEVAQDLPQFLPLILLAFISRLRNLVLHVILPLYDVISDILAGYYYYSKDVYIITGLILLFVLLPHILLSIALIWEMIINVGAFDEYPKALVRFYKSKPTLWNYLNNILKFLTLPLFTVFNFIQFFITLFVMALKLLGKMFCFLTSRFVERVGQRHPENMREQNVKEDAWSKITLLELFFETIPQLLTQVAALVALYNSEDHSNAFPVLSSIAVSILNFCFQSYMLFSFMRRTHLTLLNTVRYMMSSALDFFPIFNLYKNSADRVLLQFYDNSTLLELWGPLMLVMKHNTSLKSLTIYLEDTGDWIDMTLDLMEALEENDRLKMDTLDLCVEALTVKEAAETVKRMPEIKERFYRLLRKGTVKTVYILAHSMVNIGITDVPAEQLNTLSMSVDGFKWSWDWPKEQSNRIEYRIEVEQDDQNDG